MEGVSTVPVLYFQLTAFSNFLSISTHIGDEDDEIPDSKLPALTSRASTSGGVAKKPRLEEDAWANTMKGGMNRWIPNYNFYTWADGTPRERLTVSVLPPSGVGENYSFRIVDKGMAIELTCKLPEEMTDPDKMYKYVKANVSKYKLGMSVTDFVLKLGAMRAQMEQLVGERQHDMRTRVTMRLPIQCTMEYDMSTIVMEGDSGVQMLDINLFVRKEEELKVVFGAKSMIRRGGKL